MLQQFLAQAQAQATVAQQQQQQQMQMQQRGVLGGGGAFGTDASAPAGGGAYGPMGSALGSGGAYGTEAALSQLQQLQAQHGMSGDLQQQQHGMSGGDLAALAEHAMASAGLPQLQVRCLLSSFLLFAVKCISFGDEFVLAGR